MRHARYGRWIASAVTAMFLMAGAHSASAATVGPVRARAGFDEFNASAGSGFFSWAAASKAHPAHYDTFVLANGRRIKVNPAGTEAFGGGIDGNVLVYTQFRPEDGNDIKLFDLATRTRRNLPDVNTNALEDHPTISGDWILFTRGARGKSTRVLLYNRATGQTRRIAAVTGAHKFVYSGQLNGNLAVWGKVTPAGEDVFLYDIETTAKERIPRPAAVFAQYNPAVTEDGTVYFQRSGNRCGGNVRIMRKPVDKPSKRLVRLAPRADGGYMYAQGKPDGSTVVFFNRRKCASADETADNSWDIYKIQGA
jgi:hypothetical protein